MQTRDEIWTQILVAVIFIIGCFSFFQFLLPYHLFFKEQTQLFLLTTEYFISYFSKPAWLACYMGDFLTQFYYLRGGGAAVLTLVLLIEWWLFMQVLRQFRLKKGIPFLALIPVFIECLLHCELHYSLSVSVAFILVLSTFLLYTRIKHTWGALVFGVISLPLLYIIAGIPFFLFSPLVIIYEISERKIRLFYWLLLILIMVFFPFIMKPLYLLTTKQAYQYPLSSLKINGLNLKREKILALASESYFENWKGVNELIDAEQLPSNAVATYYTNIALSREGKLADKLLDYYQPFSQGLFLQVGPTSNWMDIFFSSDVFFHVGDMNMAQHSAMLGMIFSPHNRSSRMVKRLSEINLVNSDTTATRKYLRLLEATWFHRKWALEHEKMLSGNIEDYPWLQAKRSQIPNRDIIRMSSDYPTILNLLLESNPDNRRALDYLLCFYLLNKDIQSFSQAYDKWCKGKEIHLPKAYSEALLIKLAMTKATQKERKEYGISDEVANAFAEYTATYEGSGGNLEPLRERFGKTYWFYFHFARMKGRSGE
ncbi:hypothetical protein M2459_001223 [Parabacteroides sp. PF5-5]|uniref:DUF6057 family protein n=1 Tax=unclassified Parabacteroides TaxID=2649774 RepID=UPI0024759552|nr:MULTISPECIES: DUF6057 family protein [unclassified Parabacteroides]MDH6304490.1 hypothetical protein [Parabacteroides sp. PH5-39]MDH6315357.1 hypothetical protein [Parabacteroides sp. PF5-13]MDH6319149.1 hypothetical protein [Parabacteroides sp. PH5-13]MDH6322879.1 hypothetical protein [Parabacteroides sp. PH5-8]MDH6326549.1 hypothetical protein [Parabacteroides sp. PH5-41]